MSSDSANVSQSGIIKRLESLIAFALSRGATGSAAFAAASNNVDAIAGAVAATAVPYVAIAAPSITKKASGRYLVTGYVTIDKNGGSLAAGDNVTLEPTNGGTQIGTIQMQSAAVAATGGTARAIVPFSFIVATGGAGPFVFDVRVTDAATHTSGVLVNNGFISVVELPG